MGLEKQFWKGSTSLIQSFRHGIITIVRDQRGARLTRVVAVVVLQIV